MIRNTTLLFLLLAAAMSLALFSVKYQVQDLEQEITELNRTIINDRKAIHVLKAEWSHLNNPDQLRDRARRYLGLTPVEANQIGSIDDIPMRKEAAAAQFPKPLEYDPVNGRNGFKTASGELAAVPQQKKNGGKKKKHD